MDATTLSRIAADPAAFPDHLLIDTDAGPRRYGSVMDDWQRRDFLATVPAWRKIAGHHQVQPAHLRFYFERARGHSKTQDLGVCSTWGLAFSNRSLRMVAAAADTDQARLLLDSITRLVRLNDWLAETLEVQKNRVVNTRTGSELVTISSDVASSWGIICDAILLDEVTHWAKRELFDSLISAAAKRECLVVSIANAGYNATWQRKLYDAIRVDPAWHFSRLDGPQASWITEDRLAEQRRLLPGFAFRRLWLNEWTAGVENGIDRAQLSAAITVDGPLRDGRDGSPHYYGPFIGALDLSVNRDHSAFCVMGCNPDGRLRLAALESWDPAAYGGRVPFSLVHASVVETAKRFDTIAVVYDPHQCELMADHLLASGVSTVRFPWTLKNKEYMTLDLLDVMRANLLAMWEHPELVRDLSKLELRERAGRWTFELGRSRGEGHGDCAAAFLMANRFAYWHRRKLRNELESVDVDWEAAMAAVDDLI